MIPFRVLYIFSILISCSLIYKLPWWLSFSIKNILNYKKITSDLFLTQVLLFAPKVMNWIFSVWWFLRFALHICAISYPCHKCFAAAITRAFWPKVIFHRRDQSALSTLNYFFTFNSRFRCLIASLYSLLMYCTLANFLKAYSWFL